MPLSLDAFFAELRSLHDQFELMGPELEVTVRDAAIGVEGHVVVWNTAISRAGPLANCAKGGTRIRPGTTREEVGMLARSMAIKNAAAGLPLGGAKSGLNANPNDPNFETIYRRFVDLCRPFLHENGGTFGGFGFDLGAAPEHALWACDTLHSRRSFTGKTIEMGGTDYDREGIAGLGVAEAAVALIRHQQGSINDTRFAVQGVGAMGAAVIRYFCGHGAQLSALSDPRLNGTWELNGPPSSDLIQALSTQNFSAQAFELIQQLLKNEGRHTADAANAVLFVDTDVLFPCAVQYVLNKDNADQLQARYIVEGANNPTTVDAYAAIHQRGIIQIPDFIANSGGVIAAFVEMTSDISDSENLRTRAKVSAAKQRTQTTIAKNVQRILELSESLNVPPRDAGLYIALQAILSRDNN